MAVAVEDQALYGVVSGVVPTTVEDVIALMEKIDAVLENEDGLKWFNQLYLRVTQEVDTRPPAGGWKDAGWLLTLDVVFANFYFRAVAGSLNGEDGVPSSWQTVMESRRRTGIDRIQFALAGMNAHINHDLAYALLETDRQRGVVPVIGSSQYADYEAVNDLLRKLMPEELEMLATDKLGVLAQDTGKVGRLLAFWNICKARELAWQFANSLRLLPEIVQANVVTTQDQMTGVVGRAILALA
ncbi:DUF5995 family protein [Edaphobacter albus]|uniref:DUF5995 family protein n=1 Tax=Edaphobacter sp. 4G125 TaxID=2763071 RepID=UPI001645B0FB|nr:DUF5995 family protein [Edaphobacter sp. 4G125]QNI36102.1 hypothetical protein H7846_14015 [Edaphobacter sp. 4G125]